jgi:hypothetical protein
MSTRTDAAPASLRFDSHPRLHPPCPSLQTVVGITERVDDMLVITGWVELPEL